MDKPALLVSACLLGQAVRYDGAARPLDAAQRARLEARYRLVPVCPECLGGLPVPRPAAELADCDGSAVLAGCGQVRTRDGEDLTAAFVEGARHTLRIAREQGATHALLKAGSPSCGSRRIHDGSFSGTLRAGAGVTAALLKQHGLHVLGEDEL